MRRTTLVFAAASLAFWTVFLFLGLQSYFMGTRHGASQNDDIIAYWQPISGDPSKVASQFPDFEDEFFRGLNSLRAGYHLPLLTRDDTLSAIAREDADDMLRRDYHGFLTPEGSRLDERVSLWAPNRIGRSHGLYADFRVVGSHDVEATADVIKGWLNTDSDVSGLKDSHFGTVGIGVMEKNGVHNVVVILFENVLDLNSPMPLSCTGDAPLAIEGIYRGSGSFQTLKGEFVRQRRGFFSRWAFDHLPVSPQWRSGSVRLELPFKGSGLYRLELEFDGRKLDRHPIEVK